MTEKEKKAQITQAHIDGYNRGYAKAKADLETENNKLLDVINNQDVKVADLEKQIEKLIDFILPKTECCDVCPITDTCANSEGTCPYAGILAKGEEEVTREWLMQFISRR